MTKPTQPEPPTLDDRRPAACRSAPERGPRILFFSGGTALRGVSRALTDYTHNSIHLLTPFDSGGSSAHLRRAFGMPSVGDLRSRLIALAGRGPRALSVRRVLSHRLSDTGDPRALGAALDACAGGTDPLLAAVPEPERTLLCTRLRAIRALLPADFELRGASIGNLVLGASYLAQGRDIHAAIAEMAGLLEVRGAVAVTSEADAHLAGRLESGALVVGQHLLTGKEFPKLTSPIRELGLVTGPGLQAALVPSCARARELIASADLMCFPMGSFHTSVAANLLPTGIGAALCANPCAKVYVPNTGVDPEQVGMSLRACVDTLLALVRRDAGADTPVQRILSAIVVDRSADAYPARLDLESVEALGIAAIALDLVSPSSRPHIDPYRLAETLIALT